MSSRCCAEDPSDEGTLRADSNVTIKHQESANLHLSRIVSYRIFV